MPSPSAFVELHAGPLFRRGMASARRSRGCYRLVELYGMADMMANYISARIAEEDDAFLINAYGMLYEEITASSLIKVKPGGTILVKPDFGPLDYGINKAT